MIDKDFNKWFNKLHPSTQQVFVCGYNGIPCGSDVYEEAIKNNPEEFPEEVEHKKKWDSVPSETKDLYFKKLSELEISHYAKAPHAGSGLVFFSTHPKEHKEYSDFLEKNRPMLQKKKKQLHDKYLAEYGIKFCV